MFPKFLSAFAACLLLVPVMAGELHGVPGAAAFGARQGVSAMSLSPDGRAVADIAPTLGAGSAVMTVDLAEGSKSHVATVASGKPERIRGCHWVSNERLVCEVFGVVPSGDGVLPFTRLVAVDRVGANLKVLSTSSNEHTHGYLVNGGDVADWLGSTDAVAGEKR